MEDAAPHPVVVDLLEGLVADRALEDDALEGLALVARHQLHTHHLALTHRHVAEHLESQVNIILLAKSFVRLKLRGCGAPWLSLRHLCEYTKLKITHLFPDRDV